MPFDEQRETLDTLEEILSLLSSLTPDLADKKTISDIMLALEKILPALRENLSPSMSRLGEALAALYEKLLMEMVDDGSPGITATERGAKALRAAILGEEDRENLDRAAFETVSELVRVYGLDIEPPAEPESAEPSGADKGGEDEEKAEDDDFFAEMSRVPAREREEGGEEEEARANPLAGKLSDLAADITMMEADMRDKKAVSGIMLKLESLSSALLEEGYPEAASRLALTLAAVYEKSLMEGIEEGGRALDLTTAGINALSALVEGVEPPEEAAGKLGPIISAMEEEFGAAVPSKEEPAAPVEEQPAAAEPAQSPRKEGEYTIHVADGDELLIYSEFVSEMADATHSMETDLLELEANPGDTSAMDNLYRTCHSLKGASGFLGLSTINVLCHEAETLLDKLKKRELVFGQDVADALLKMVDVIKLVNDDLGHAVEESRQSLPEAALRLPRYDVDPLVDIFNELAARGDAAGGPGAGEEAAKLGEILKERKVISEEQLEKALGEQARRPLGQILVDMGAADAGAVSEALKAQEEKKRKGRVSALKVDTEKLNALLELVGELVISQSIVTQDEVLKEEMNRGLSKNIMNMGKVTRNIQDQVMSLRMVPLRQTFQKMSRLLRDLSKKMNKPVSFEVSGEDTEIDKTIIEELNDPLVHLLRNAMDHGVETPDERRAAGKSATGRVSINAFHRGGNVHIVIRDDGRGLDKEKILGKARSRGLVPADAELSDAEALNLIFAPGFSTHDVATDISGRGVGMDVVRSNIEGLGGRVEISSRPGEGSAFTIKLPLTMAIMDGMIVKVGAERFIIPTIAIRESIRPRPEDVATVRREGEMVNVRGSLIPLLRLCGLLGTPGNHAAEPWEGLVIIVELDDREYGFMVDDLLGQQQVVIKSLGKRFKGLPGVSGGTILGDGRVGLILDVSGVVGMA